MATILTDQEALRKLKVPWRGEGIPPGWTENADGSYTHSDGTIVFSTPTTVSVSGFEDFLLATKLNNLEFAEFMAVTFGSLDQVTLVGSTDEEKANYLKQIQEALEDALEIIQSKRVLRNRTLSLPSVRTEAPEDSELDLAVAASKNIASKIFNAETYIGPVVISPEIPIVEVEVNENYDFKTLRTLRGITDPVLKTHNNDISLSITLEYPQHLINDKVNDDGHVVTYGLRTLLATLKIAPVCEISSTALIPVFVNSILSPEIFDSLRDKALADGIGVEKLIERQVEQLETVQTGDYAVDLAKFKEFIGTLNPIIDYIANVPSKAEIETKNIVPPIPTINSRFAGKTTAGLTVPCAFQGAVIKTSPDKTNHFLVKLFFYRHNDQAWQPGKILYRDKNGDLTPDVFLCPWITRMAQKIFFTEDKSYSGVDYMTPYTVPTEGEAGMEFEWEDPLTNERLIFKPNAKEWLIEDIEARSFMKIAKQSLVGSPYPVCQYFGIDNVHAHVSVVVSDPIELAKFHEMKAELDKINYDIGPPRKRRHFVTIRNNVLNFLGARDFVITGITSYVDNNRDVWRLEFDLIESRLSIDDVEQIVLLGDDTKELEDLKALWGHLYDLLSETSTTPQVVGQTGTTIDRRVYKTLPISTRNVQFNELGDEGQLAHRIVFGTDDRGLSSVIHPNMMAATWYSLVQKSKGTDYNNYPGNRFFRWDTGWSNDPKISAVMEGRQFEGMGAVFSNDRDDVEDSNIVLPSVVSFSWAEGPDGNRVMQAFNISGPYNPVSILDFSDDPQNLSSPRRASIIEKESFNWLSKGQYDLPDGFDNFQQIHATVTEFVTNTVSDSAQLNIFEQGQKYLYDLGTTWRRDVFFSREFWDEYFNIVMYNQVRPDLAEEKAWESRDIDIARTNILSLIRLGIYEKFPSFLKKYTFKSFDSTQEGIRVSNLSGDPGAANPTVSNYADIRLPTYSSMFGPGDLWRKFAPTYSDLGKKPPFSRMVAFESLEDAVNQIARKVNDPIEPSLPYYHKRLKGEVFTKYLEDQDRIAKSLEGIKNRTIVVPTSIVRMDGAGSPGSAIGSWLQQIYNDPSKASDPLAFNRQNDRARLRALVSQSSPTSPSGEQEKRINNIVLISEEGQLLGTVTKGVKGTNPIKFNKFERGVDWKIFSGTGEDVFEPYSQNHITKTHVDIASRLPDTSLNMARLFPSYRLYFIEEDSSRVWFVDDLYGTNAVISLSLRQDKWDADVLTCLISNTAGNLSEEEILSTSAQQKLGLSADDEGEAYFSRLKLQSGVKVQLRMGYGTLASDLEIVFTGMITEIRPGKVVEIVAQGHKRELLNEVQFDVAGVNHFDIIKEAIELTEHPNLGDEYSARQIGTSLAGILYPPNVDPKQYISSLDRLFNTKTTNVMRNVYLNSQAPIESGRRVYFDRNLSATSFSLTNDFLKNANIFTALGIESENQLQEALRRYIRDNAEDGLRAIGLDLFGLLPWMFSAPTQDGGHWASWVVPPQSCWEAILEVTRHRPGHIAQVVPFGTKGTLFVGQPEQPYYAEKASASEEFTYSRLNNLVSLESRTDFHKDLLRNFVQPNNPWFRVYRAHGRFTQLVTLEPYTILGLTVGGTSHGLDSVLLDDDESHDLSELPDNDDVAEVITEFNPQTNPQRHQYFLRQMTSYLGELPPGFEISDWAVHPADMTKGSVLENLNEIDPSLFEQLFYWYFDLSPEAARVVLGPDWAEMRHFMLSPENQIFKDRLSSLSDPNNPLSIPYRVVHVSSDNFTRSVLGTPEDEIDSLLSRGLITQDRADQLRHNIIDPSTAFVSRSEFQDVAYERMQESLKDNDSLAAVVRKNGGGFRLFLYYLNRFIISEGLNRGLNKSKVAQSTRKIRMFDLPPGYKVFRSYHMIGPKDIISNGIYASMSEMSNCVLVRAPKSEISYDVEESQFEDEFEGQDNIILKYEDTDWVSYPTTDGIPFNPKLGKQNRKLGVVYELNALSKDQKARVMMSNMGLLLQPMYRGELKVVGRNIKPHDVVYLDDPENEIRGHFEVASVIHHMDPEMGWVSIIEPHMLVRVNNPTSEIQLGFAQSMLRDLSGFIDVLEVGLGVVTILSLALGPIGRGAAGLLSTGAKTITSAAVKSATKKVVQTTATQWLRKSSARVSSIPILSKLGKSTISGVGAVTAFGSIVGAYHLADAFVNLHVKHVVGSYNLPIDAHLLLYRGQYLQAGMEIDQEDVYSIFDKFSGLGKDIRKDLEDFFVELANDISGVDNIPVGEQLIRIR